MQDEINLRPLIYLLWRHWRWIVGSGLALAVLTAVALSLLPRTYEATVYLFVTRSEQYQISSLLGSQVVPHLNTFTEPNKQGLPAYPQMALTDEVLTQVLAALEPTDGVDSVDALRRKVSALNGEDLTVIRLIVQNSDPATAAHIANVWGEVFTAWLNDLYGDTSDSQLQGFTAQLTTAQAEFATANANLIDFQGQNRAAVLNNALSGENNRQNSDLGQQELLNQLQSSITIFREQLGQRPFTEPLPIADQLTALNFQLAVYTPNPMTVPAQIQTNSTTTLTTTDRATQIALLDALLEAIAQKQAFLASDLATIETSRLALQKELQAITAELNTFLDAQTMAQETVTTLNRRLTEERLRLEGNRVGVRLISQALPPARPLSLNKVTNSLVAGILGLLLGVLGVSVVGWWRQELPRQGPSRRQEERPSQWQPPMA